MYLAALPYKFVDFLEQHDTFQFPFDSYTWGEIYIIITKTMVGLCTNMKMNNSLQKMSRLPDQKSICHKYGLSLDDPIVKRRKAKKQAKKAQKQNKIYPAKYKKSRKGHQKRKGYYKYVPKTHYYQPVDIHLRSHK